MIINNKKKKKKNLYFKNLINIYKIQITIFFFFNIID